MQLIEEGGFVMWPLIAISVLVIAVILDRLLVFTTQPLVDPDLEARLIAAGRGEATQETLATAIELRPTLRPLLEALFAKGAKATREGLATIAIEEIIRGLDRRVGVLGMAARVAPLLGLLGTVIGMIQTFSRLSAASGAIDMTMLADGIWQALLTTATGLVIAIPAVIAHGGFLRREEHVNFALARLANRVLMAEGSPGERAA
ncbi:MotA/TolQ/ExbB proton channel family protein [Breoghania sp.]|uniref:MotA/TolQ/ExbB proton channel family protein n=1 Tax=Breoghania sp. TaxID=2065378 RepID=UPI0029CAAB2A|nr:MotA/TolQ/ExbB proton channel family protein [Breoghania sp.]